MNAKSLKCVMCQTEYPLSPLYECEKCGGILTVTFSYPESIAQELCEKKTVTRKADLLPVAREYLVSIGEGNTPLITANKFSRRIGINDLLLKCEFCNPTGSFKDRPVSVGISKAQEFGFKKVIVASSGNGASAVAALAAKAGIEALVLVPESTPPEKVKQAAYYGARVIKVEGSYSNSFLMAKEISQKSGGFFNLTTTFINPYTVDGDKIIAYELFSQMDGIVPDAIVVPIGAGPLLAGIFKGYEEMKRMKVIAKLPKMIGVQADGCSPIAKAYQLQKRLVESEDNPQTVASGICDGLTGYAKDGTYTLDIILKSNGYSLSCDDASILEAQRWFAIDEGIFVEPSSATTSVAIQKSIQEQRISPDEIVVAILTGHGLKDMGSASLNIEIPTVANDVNKALELLG